MSPRRCPIEVPQCLGDAQSADYCIACDDTPPNLHSIISDHSLSRLMKRRERPAQIPPSGSPSAGTPASPAYINEASPKPTISSLLTPRPHNGLAFRPRRPRPAPGLMGHASKGSVGSVSSQAPPACRRVGNEPRSLAACEVWFCGTRPTAIPVMGPRRRGVLRPRASGCRSPLALRLPSPKVVIVEVHRSRYRYGWYISDSFVSFSCDDFVVMWALRWRRCLALFWLGGDVVRPVGFAAPRAC